MSFKLQRFDEADNNGGSSFTVVNVFNTSVTTNNLSRFAIIDGNVNYIL